MLFGIEYAKSSKAQCRSEDCRHSTKTIYKNEVRFFRTDQPGFYHWDCLPGEMAGQIASLQAIDGSHLLSVPDARRVEALIRAKKKNNQRRPSLQPTTTTSVPAESSNTALAVITRVLHAAVDSLDVLLTGAAPAQTVQQLHASLHAVLERAATAPTTVAEGAPTAPEEPSPLISFDEPTSTALMQTPSITTSGAAVTVELAEETPLVAQGMGTEGGLPEDTDVGYAVITPGAAGSDITAAVSQGAAGEGETEPATAASPVGTQLPTGNGPSSPALVTPAAVAAPAVPPRAAPSSAAAPPAAGTDTTAAGKGKSGRRKSKGEKQVAAAQAALQQSQQASTSTAAAAAHGAYRGNDEGPSGGGGTTAAAKAPTRRLTPLERLARSLGSSSGTGVTSTAAMATAAAAVSPNTARERRRKQQEYSARIKKANQQHRGVLDALPRFKHTMVTPSMMDEALRSSGSRVGGAATTARGSGGGRGVSAAPAAAGVKGPAATVGGMAEGQGGSSSSSARVKAGQGPDAGVGAGVGAGHGRPVMKDRGRAARLRSSSASDVDSSGMVSVEGQGGQGLGASL